MDVTLRGPTGDLTPGSLDVVAGTVVDKVLLHSFEEPGYVPISFGLEPDGLPEDDVRYGLADVRREVRTLIVDGAPSGVPMEDEIFYLERALAAGAPDIEEAAAILTGSEKGSSDEGTSRVAAIARRGFGNPDNVASWLLLFMLFAFLLESALTTQRRGH